jgi:HAD superfamily hydrolase (TIGR01662 family)
MIRYSIVIPTIGRDCLADLLDALAVGWGPEPERIVVVDDRRDPDRPLPVDRAARRLAVQVISGDGRGPAAARNRGWQECRSPWIAFLDDDVVPEAMWSQRLVGDIDRLGHDAAASQGRIFVPLPAGRRATDWERNVSGLERARWATADMAYRRSALEALGGFDERFPRAFREDADLALRAVAAGYRIDRGHRVVFHPVRPADRWVSLRLQAGNRDDALMRRLHGSDWYERADADRGRIRRHAATSLAALGAVGLGLARRPRWAAGAALAWAAGVGELAWARIAPGPRTASEVATMLATSAVMAPVATFHRLAGEWQWRHVRLGRPPRQPKATPAPAPPAAVLFDRDGTLVHDVPYNGDPTLVEPLPTARPALDRLRAAGLRIAVVTNQSGVGRGLVSIEQVQAVNRRIEELLGPFDTWAVCHHAPEAGCACRKPAAGLILHAAAELGVEPSRCVVVGDIGADLEAARAAGARGILVPNGVTRPEEVAKAACVASDLGEAAQLILEQV